MDHSARRDPGRASTTIPRNQSVRTSTRHCPPCKAARRQGKTITSSASLLWPLLTRSRMAGFNLITEGLKYYPNAHAAELGRTRGRGLPDSSAPMRAQNGKKAKAPCAPRGRRHHEEAPQIETIGRELRVWRDQGTNKIVIEPPVFAPTKKRDGLISLSTKHARHLASSLLLFAEEAESSPTFTAVKKFPSQVAPEERAISRLNVSRMQIDHAGEV